MGAKTGNSLATFLLSIPIAAVGLMAIFGVPEFAPLNASPDENVVVRDPYESHARSEWQEGDRGSSAPYYGSPPAHGRDQGLHFENENHTGNGSAWPLRPPAGELREEFGRTSHSGDRERFESESRGPGPYGGRAGAESGNAPDAERDSRLPGQPSRDGRDVRSDGLPRYSAGSSASTSLSDGQRPFPVGREGGALAHTSDDSRKVRPDQLVSWREASRRLAEMGIGNYHLERGADEHSFLFVCLFTPGGAPHVTHRFEAEDEDPLVAVNRVLRQIARWQQRRFAEERFPGDSNRL